jgi:hypothetical protein
MAKKKIDGVKVPKRILGHKLRKGTRKDIAALVKAVGHPDAKSLVAAAVGAIGPMIADRLTHRSDKLKAVK